MTESPTPIFVLSLPRAGSTLLQRLLAAHPAVRTAAEPWILLPMLSARRPDVAAAYNHRLARAAIDDFVHQLPEGDDSYYRAVGLAVSTMYRGASKNPPNSPVVRYFVDKTPRYHLVASELKRTFPEAKFVFLWRNPVASLASMVETFGGGRWIVHAYKVDLFSGVKSLLGLQEQLGDEAFVLRYEDMVLHPEGELRRLFSWLDLDPPQFVLPVERIPGTFGDHTGTAKYSEVSTDSLGTWPRSVANPVRRHWVKRYLKWLGRERLALMGYDMDDVLNDVNSARLRLDGSMGDLVQLAYGEIWTWLSPFVINEKRRLTWHERFGYS